MIEWSGSECIFGLGVVVGKSGEQVAMAEWLRRQTRNLLGKPAQVRILLATFFYISPITTEGECTLMRHCRIV
jgi:hypothetical protein